MLSSRRFSEIKIAFALPFSGIEESIFHDKCNKDTEHTLAKNVFFFLYVVSHELGYHYIPYPTVYHAIKSQAL